MRPGGLLALIGLLWGGAAHAHNPLSARFDLVFADGGAVLSAALSQDGVHSALVRRDGKEAVAKLDPAAYKKRVIGYLKGCVDLKLDGKALRLGAGGIRLGAHQTDVRLVVEGVRAQAKAVTLRANCFKENPNHQSLVFVQAGATKQRVILSKAKGWTAAIRLGKGSENVE